VVRQSNKSTHQGFDILEELFSAAEHMNKPIAYNWWYGLIAKIKNTKQVV
jgi:hypothetical protein